MLVGVGGEFRGRRRCDISNIVIRQSGVREKFMCADLDPGPNSAFESELQRPGSLANSRGADEGSEPISIPGHYAARP
jgi:hypothetical protein